MKYSNSSWGRLLKEPTASRNVWTEREIKEMLLARGRKLRHKTTPSSPPWRIAAMRAMGDLGFRLRWSDRVYVRMRATAPNATPANTANTATDASPANTANAVAPRFIRTGPDVYIARRKPAAAAPNPYSRRSTTIGGAL
jgi:hypothetical protein